MPRYPKNFVFAGRQRNEHVEHEALLTLLASVNHVPNMRDTLAPREHTLLWMDGDGRNFSATLIGRICQILVIVVATRGEKKRKSRKYRAWPNGGPEVA